jgi:hypothetical protein
MRSIAFLIAHLISLLNGRLEDPCHLEEGNSLTKKSAIGEPPQIQGSPANWQPWSVYGTSPSPAALSVKATRSLPLPNRGPDNKTVSICAELHSAQPPPKMVAQRQDVRFAYTVVQWQGGYRRRTAQPGRGSQCHLKPSLSIQIHSLQAR